ncbi:oxidoreductase [Rhodopila sp.]|uniref:oxidoreductase n=1 Tax=Rhodopila sp. TaxID=2480087 RepID=UPI003D0F97D9
MKTWLITGISSGLGQALAQAALDRGDTVIGTVRADAADLNAGTGNLHVLQLDVADKAAVETAVARAFELGGQIDVLVNNAGYGLLGAIEEATDAEVAHLFEVNVFGPFRLIRAALPRLRAQGRGHIINVTSIAGRAPMASSGAYAAAKSAMEGLSQSLSQEVGPLGIKVTAVAPGDFRTNFLSDHSIRRSTGVGDAYAGTVGRALAHLDEIAGKQIGDPARGAAAILAAVDSETPPLHLLLGSDALRRVREKVDAVIEEMDRWEDVTRGTDFPAQA